MWRSRMFWRLFLTYNTLLLTAIGLLGVVLVQRAQRLGLVSDNSHDELAELHRLVWTTAGATALATTLLTFYLSRRITQPLQELTEGAARIAAGGHGHKVYPGGRDEVGTLAQSFNHMSEGLATQFAQLEEDRQQLRAILSGMVEGVVALDAELRILFANERAVELFEVASAQAIVGRKLWEVSRQRSLLDLVERAVAAGQPREEELIWNGRIQRTLKVHVARLAGPIARGAVLVLHDTTDLRRLEQVRQEFVANVSHELKTPLSVIQACVETLLDGAVDDSEHRGPFLERIAEQGNRLYALILDLLSLARIESSAEAFHFQKVSLGEAVEECLNRHLARAEAKNQTLLATPPPTEADTVWADEEAIGQILDNLVDNALKYTPAGGRIEMRWHGENGHVLIEVQDTGIGIPPRDLPRIFERFYRVDKARSRALGGTGLGLSIVKHLAQAMDGSVWADSQPGQGATFFVRLPTTKHDKEPKKDGDKEKRKPVANPVPPA
jgi:two-component system, OmpR family, phosphate regulon sensor histidine kinase PhoR